MNFFKEFREFAVKGNVMDMAVGVIIGTAFGKIVTSFINDVIMPPLGALVGNVDFSDLKFTIKEMPGAAPVTLNYGAFLTQVVDFSILAFVVFLMVKGINVLKRKDPPPTPTQKECPECAMTIPLKARKCGHCASGLTAALLLLAFTFIGGPLRAEEAAPGKKWTETAQVTYLSANGNTKSTTLGVNEAFKYAWDLTALELAAAALGSSQNGSTTAEQYNASEKVQRKVSDKNYVFERVAWDKNRFAGVSNRIDASLGLGREVWKSAKNLLTLELGGGYVNEQRVKAPREDFGSGRAYTKWIHTLSETANFSQDAEYLHNFSDQDAFRLNTETALTASITTHFSLKTSFFWKKVNVPPPGFAKNDTMTSVALIFNY